MELVKYVSLPIKKNETTKYLFLNEHKLFKETEVDGIVMFLISFSTIIKII